MNDIDNIREHHDEYAHFERLSMVVPFDVADEAAFLSFDRLLAAERGQATLTAVTRRVL